jgi:signal recognition particle GTPase
MVIKIVHDELINLLGSENSGINFNARPVIIMLVGLQGAGKTTTAGKLAARLKNKNHKKVLLASLDTYRPAAQEQLGILAQKIGTDCVEIIAGQNPLEITKRTLEKAEDLGSEVIILDTAGRTHLNEELMQELLEIKQLSNPTEILLVVDSLIGQDAINVAQNFNEKLAITGIILTRLDGDGRGGAALTMKAATNCPIKFIGVGEKLDELEEQVLEEELSLAISSGKITADKKKELKALGKSNPESLRLFLSAVPEKKAVKLSEQLKQGNTATSGTTQKLSWYLKNDQQGLAEIKENDPAMYEKIVKNR